MKYEQLREPREVEIDGKVFAVSKIPALKARPIYNIISELVSSHGLVGLTQIPEVTMKDILQFACYKTDAGDWEGFDTDARINNCFTSYGTFVSLVLEMEKENFSFLTDGGLQSKLEAAAGAAASAL